MRYARRAAVAALTMTALLAHTAPATASAPAEGGGATPPASVPQGTSGGAKAPSVSLAGGSEYGVFTPSTLRPVVGELSVPSIATAGRPPRVALRIDEAGVGTVNVVVTVLDLSSRKPVIAVGLGWVHTGRMVTVGWPRGLTLKPGVYHVSLKARDHHARTLLRRAHSSGVATLTIRTPGNPSDAPPGGVVPEAGVPTPAQSAGAGAVFPVAGPHNFGGPDNRFGAPRGSHTHQGQDVLTAEGTAVVAPLAGRIITANYQAGGAGLYAAEHTDVGLDFMFAHCESGSLAVSTGQAVAAGQTLCQAGHTGDATTPHLHFEIWLGGWQTPAGHPIDPLAYLQAWDHTGAAG
jgi:biotin carboxyl carrier protein